MPTFMLMDAIYGIKDELFFQAVELVIQDGGNSVAVAYLQRKLRIGYARADRLMKAMESLSIVERLAYGKYKCLYSVDDCKTMKGLMPEYEGYEGKIAEQQEKIRNLTETVGEGRDLTRVRGIIADHSWIFAKTYAAFCPHEYTLRKDWENDDDYRFLVSFVWRYGLEAYFGKKEVPNRYWFDHENGYYYFVFPEDTDEEGSATDQVILVNRAKICDFDFWKDEERGIIRCARHRERDSYD